MFDSVLGRAVAAPDRSGTGAAVSLGLHALALALAVVLGSRLHQKTEPPLEALFFPRPLGGSASDTTRRPAPAPRPHRPERSRPLALEPRPAPASPEQPAVPDSVGDAAGIDPESVGTRCTTEPCGEPSAGGSTGVLFLRPEMTAPRLLFGPEPRYPVEAARDHVGGSVVVQCTVTERGTVEDCRVLASLPLLDQEVLRALEARRYSAALYEGRPVAVRMVFTVRVVPR